MAQPTQFQGTLCLPDETGFRVSGSITKSNGRASGELFVSDLPPADSYLLWVDRHVWPFRITVADGKFEGTLEHV